MAYLLDTGILLRLVNADDANYTAVNRAVRALVARQEQLHITDQNVAEFLNVATRPVANNGFGWRPETALDALTIEIEPFCSILLPTVAVHDELKRLVSTRSVVGKQIHDARLVAMMLVSNVRHILTLNERDFRRYEPEGITVVTPESILGSP
jgi:predicted nucleic acid-binding protein